jgi:hypothetical protein
VDDSDSYNVVPAGFAITWNSGTLASPPGRGASVASLAGSAYDSDWSRFVYGVSQDSYTGPSFAAGARSPSGVKAVTLVYEAAYIPGGSVGTTNDATSGGGGASSVTGGNGTVALTHTLNDGVVTLLMTDAELKDVIDKSDNKTAAFDLSKVPNGKGVTLAKADLDSLAEAGLSAEFKLAQGTIALDNKALKSAITQAGGANVSLSLVAVAQSGLTAAQQAAIKPSDLVFSVSAASGAQVLRSFGGMLTVTLPYDGPTPVAVWYLNDAGVLERLDCVFDQAAKKVSFTTDHLSLYVVGQENDGKIRIRLAIGALSYTVGGVLKAMDVAPMLVNDRTMVPLRFIAEALGADVGWDGQSMTATVKLGGATLAVAIGEMAPGMDTPAMLVDSRTMVPLRYVQESLGCDVLWNGDTQTIDITK